MPLQIKYCLHMINKSNEYAAGSIEAQFKKWLVKNVRDPKF